MANTDFANQIIRELSGATLASSGTIACTGLGRSDSSTPLEFELAASTVDTYQFGFSYSTLVAAGADATDSTAIVRMFNLVTGADGTKGVLLPELLVQNYAVPFIVYNDDTTNALKVWGNTTGTDDTINGATSFTVPAKCMALFLPLDASKWYGNVIAFASAPSTYTQTFSTADRTVANATAATLTVTDGAGTNDGTIGAITDNASTISAVQELADQINKLVADNADLRQAITAIIDDLQAQKIVL